MHANFKSLASRCIYISRGFIGPTGGFALTATYFGRRGCAGPAQSKQNAGPSIGLIAGKPCSHTGPSFLTRLPLQRAYTRPAGNGAADQKQSRADQEQKQERAAGGDWQPISLGLCEEPLKRLVGFCVTSLCA